MSVGGSREPKDDPDSWLNGIVVDAQEIVQGDVWSITIEYAPTATRPRSTEQLYVVEATCEVRRGNCRFPYVPTGPDTSRGESLGSHRRDLYSRTSSGRTRKTMTGG